MAKAALKGLTIKIGGDTSDLLDSLKDVEKRGKSLSGELGQINKLLKLDPKNTELLAQKQKVLADAIVNTEKKLDTLREAEKQAQEQFKKGEIAEEQYRALKREIVETENKLKSYERAAQETADAQKDLADNTKDAADETDNMDDSANDLASGGMAAMAAAAVGVVTAIVALAEETREYRNEMAKLDTAFQTSGFSSEAATRTYEALQSVLGETEQAVEAANHLAKLASTEEDLAAWTDTLTGVYATFGASLPIEGLAEAANETAKTGAVTGALADALNWAASEGETFGVTVKGNTSASNQYSKSISDTEAKLNQLKNTEKANKEQLEASKTALSNIKDQIKATKEKLAEYKKEAQGSSGRTAEWTKTISETVAKLESLEAQEEQAAAALKKSQESSKASSSQLKDEIKATNAQLAEYKKAAQGASAPTEEWNKKVEEAASAEDYFNLALENCSNEQERQQLITETLTRLYGDAATKFKTTNREVIRANQATEKWNKATAKVGKTVEPVMTDIKEMGVILLEDASEPLEDIAGFIRTDVIPSITAISGWVRKNGKLIKSTLVGIGAAMVAFKVATIATTVAQKGLKGAIMATTVAQKALALAQAATPWGLAATAIAGVVTVLAVLTAKTDDAAGSANALTDEERELMAAADEAAEAFRDQRAATDEALGNVTAEMQHTQDLANELMNLADASGKVKEEDKARAQFILNELNDALGTEYSMTGNVIDNYKELKKSINDVIQAKLANSLLEAENAAYIQAIQDEGEAFTNARLKEKDYLAQKEASTKAWKTYSDYYKQWVNGELPAQMGEYITELKGEAEAELAILGEKREAYNEADNHYKSLQETKFNYMAAEEAALQGNYQTAVDLLAKKGNAYVVYSDEVDEETAKVLSTLKKEAEDARIKAELFKKNFEDGVANFSQPMVDEAEKKYKEALDKYKNAYNDAYGIGENFGQGVADGIKIKDGTVGAAAISQINAAVLAAKKAAEIKSPSRVTRKEVGAQLGEGNKLGIEDTTKDVEKAASKQMDAVLTVYRTEEVNAQRAIRTVADQQVARQTTAQMSAAVTYNAVLDRILAAIEKGQVLTIDGETLVGATALAMDNALGRRRDLAARGAL